jgi:hypothetical protein
LGWLDVHPGTRLANIGNMPDVQLNPAPRNAFRDALKVAPNSAPKLPKAMQERVPQRAVEYVHFTEFPVQM